MTTPKHHIFTKAFWNRSRIIWGTIVALCTSIPLVGGSVIMASKWTEAKIVSPYLEKKFDSVCYKNSEPIRKDVITMRDDMKFVRGCIEATTPPAIQDKVLVEMKKDSIAEHKYVTR